MRKSAITKDMVKTPDSARVPRLRSLGTKKLERCVTAIVHNRGEWMVTVEIALITVHSLGATISTLILCCSLGGTSGSGSF